MMAEGIAPRDHSPFAALRQLARGAAPRGEEHCDLCGAAVAREHRHILNVATGELLCACRACAVLFDRAAAGGGARRLVPTRYLCLRGFAMTDAEWEGLHIPVNMAFFSNSSAAGRVLALYPGPSGPTESLLALETWRDLEERNPVLRGLEPDVEALLVNRLRETRDYFLVPIDECYKLVGLIRLSWRGLSGGREVWQEIEQFFAHLKERARIVEHADA